MGFNPWLFSVTPLGSEECTCDREGVNGNSQGLKPMAFFRYTSARVQIDSTC